MVHQLDYRARSIPPRLASELPKECAEIRWLADREFASVQRGKKDEYRAGSCERRSSDAMSELHRRVGPDRSIG